MSTAPGQGIRIAPYDPSTAGVTFHRKVGAKKTQSCLVDRDASGFNKLTPGLRE